MTTIFGRLTSRIWRRYLVCLLGLAIVGALALHHVTSRRQFLHRSIAWSWQPSGWNQFRAYDPCRRPDGTPSAAMFYQLGPLMITTLRFASAPPAPETIANQNDEETPGAFETKTGTSNPIDPTEALLQPLDLSSPR